MHIDQQAKPSLEELAHEYDPVKAHEYYIRNRKLKGRRKAAPKYGGPRIKDIQTKKLSEKWPDAKAQTSAQRFLARLPMAQEGAGLKTTVQFVKKMQGMTDDEMQAEADRIKKEKGKFDGAQVATIHTLLDLRKRIRAKRTGAQKSTAKKTKPSGQDRAARARVMLGKPRLK